VSETIIKGKPAVAMHFGVSERTVRRWAKDSSFPRLSGGRFDLIQIQSWLDAKDGRAPTALARAGDARQPELPIQRGKDYEEQRFKRLKADLAEIELRKARGELIEVAGLEALLAPRAQAYRQGLISFEQLLVPRLVTALGLPPESIRILTVVVREVAREVLENVLRDLTLPAGQVLRWEEGSPRLGDDEHQE
jgi:phage terminase Nu1 subunit (DNA packaging protein)